MRSTRPVNLDRHSNYILAAYMAAGTYPSMLINI
jgi:hypothetical protein